MSLQNCSQIILKGNPLSTNNIYRRHGFTIYLSKDGSKLKEYYQWEVKTQWKEDIQYKELELDIKLYFGDKRKRDIDNFNKLVLDSMTGIVYLDDKQIQKLTVEKLYDKKNPRVEIIVKKVGT